MNSRLLVIVTMLVSIVTLSACVYRLDIPQGNRIDAEVIAQLQVEFLLGEPAIKDPYHAGVWHYVYYLKSGKDGSIEKRVLTLRFTNDQLSSIEGSLEGNPGLDDL